MSLIAFFLVLTAAFTHASWNLLAKRAADCRHFVWLYSTAAVLLWLPMAIGPVLLTGPDLGASVLGAFLVSGILHALYATSLQRGYKAGELSVVYPLARGTGPLISFFGAILVLGERPSLLASGGALLVVAGVFLLAGRPSIARLRASGRGVWYGLLTGLFIASYTVWDGWAVKVLLVSPILLDYAGNCFRSLIYAPRAIAERGRVRMELAKYWREAAGVGALGPLGYILVLYAMQMAPVSQVAPARELSMMVGAYFGVRLLKEGDAPRRLAASLVIVTGVAALALG